MALTEAHFFSCGGKEGGNSYGIMSCMPARAQNDDMPSVSILPVYSWGNTHTYAYTHSFTLNKFYQEPPVHCTWLHKCGLRPFLSFPFPFPFNPQIGSHLWIPENVWSPSWLLSRLKTSGIIAGLGSRLSHLLNKLPASEMVYKSTCKSYNLVNHFKTSLWLFAGGASRCLPHAGCVQPLCDDVLCCQ